MQEFTLIITYMSRWQPILNRRVFNAILNCRSVVVMHIDVGKVLHSDGPETAYALMPNSVLVRETYSLRSSTEWRRRPEWTDGWVTHLLVMYKGARLCYTDDAVMRSLKWMGWIADSQWSSSLSTSEMWSYFWLMDDPIPLLRTDCRQTMLDAGSPGKTQLQ